MLRDQPARVESWLRRAQGLARRAPLGENPVGHAMAAKFEHRAGAVDDDMSLAGVLMPYRRVLVAAHDAVDQGCSRRSGRRSAATSATPPSR